MTLRVSALSDEKVVHLVSTNFVPVALDLVAMKRDKADPGPEGLLWRPIQTRLKNFYQGICIVTPDGEVLVNQQDPPPAADKSMTAHLLECIDQGLKAWGRPLEPRPQEARDPWPHRGVGYLPDGGVSLAVNLRHTLNHARPVAPLGALAADSISLSKAEWAKLAPPAVKAGAEWSVPEDVGRKFNRLLSGFSDQVTLTRPEEVKEVRLVGRVERVEGGVAYLRYEGRIAGVHELDFEPHIGKPTHAKAKLVGAGTCDAKDGRRRSFTLVADGGVRDSAGYTRPHAGVVEWDRERPRR